MTMNKEKVMHALLSADCDIPGDVIAYIGNNLQEKANASFSFKHDEDTVWDACGVSEKDAKEMTKSLNLYMNSLPSGERQKSKAVEYVLNSGNQKWLTIITVIGLENIHAKEDNDKGGDELKDMLLKALLRKLKDKDEE